MLRKSALIAVLTVIIPVASVQGQRPLNPSTGRDFLEACDASGEFEVVFVGRLEEPVTFRISGEEEIEKARQDVIRAEAEMARLNASQDVKTGLERDRELAIAMAVFRARQELDFRQARYPPPYDLTLFPVIVEQAFRGVTEPTLMLRRTNTALRMEPGERYLITGTRTTNMLPAFKMLNLAPVDDYVDAASATAVASAQQELRFFAATAPGGTILGTLEDRAGAPLAGVRIEVRGGIGVRETITREDGSFTASGIESGRVTIKPFLNDDLGVVNASALTFQIVERGCKTVRLTAALNGRLSGRIISATGKSLAFVEVSLQQVDLQRLAGGLWFDRNLPRTSVRPSEDGTFQFSGQIPGSYLLSAYVETVVDGKVRHVTTFYPGTPDPTTAAPITIGRATQHDGFDFFVMNE
jgi:hypothetical protein